MLDILQLAEVEAYSGRSFAPVHNDSYPIHESAMTLKPLFIALSLTLFACSKAPEPAPPIAPGAAAPSAAAIAAHGIAWQSGDVDAVFAAAKSDRKPVFLYWGAKWCPPCNQVKATIFDRQDFIERSRHFAPVYVDGDSPSAQRLGSRFKVSGYPTMILFTPDGREITRLPGEVDADQYMRVLALGMNGARPVKETLAAALSSGSDSGNRLSPDDWRMLSFYSWDTDEGELVAKGDVATTLQRLAKACPAGESATATRLELQALTALATAKDMKPRNDPVAVAFLRKVLADPETSRANFDILTNYAGKLAKSVALPKSREGAELATAWNAALSRFAGDASLSTADRLSALTAQVELAKRGDDEAPVPAALQASVRAEVARADHETTDPYARQAVISTAADALEEAGLLAESDALLKAELTRSHSPYYFMLGLAANAKKRGDKTAALEWYEKAYADADGPATRLQWGVAYVNALVDLAPQDAMRIEATASHVIRELEAKPDTFFGRNQRALERLGKKLAAWDKGNRHHDSLQRIRVQMAGVCGSVPTADPARALCDGALRPKSA